MIVLVFLTALGAAFIIYSITASINYKRLRLEGIEKTVSYETEKVNKVISELERAAIFYAMSGMLIYESKSPQLGEIFALEFLSSFPSVVGGGFWFEPYAYDKEQMRRGFYAFNDKNTGKTRMDDSFFTDEYDYHNSSWYKEITSYASRPHEVIWSKPYHDSSGSFSLMTTAGSPVFENGKLIAISTIDWEIDDVIKELTDVKPTENSFVLLCVPEKDYVISSTRTRGAIGATMQSIPWDITADVFELDGVTYMRFSRFLDNGWFMSVQIPENEIFYDMENRNRQFSVFAVFASIFIVYFAWLFISVYINEPIKKLTSGVSQLALGNLDTQIDVRSNDELGLLAGVFNQMTGELKKTIDENIREHAEKERIGTELNVASTIQTSMLPSVFPPFPDKKEFDLYALMQPAKEVGGDFYDFYLVNDDNLAVIVADVSGKGVPAALFMVITKTLLIENSSSRLSPKKVFEKVNAKLLVNNEAGMFVTAFMGFYNIPTGRFTYSSAGHNPPLLKKKNGNFEYIKNEPCIILGWQEGAKYSENEITLEKGDILYLYTDGVTEAMNENSELFSEERLLDTVNRYGDYCAKEFLNAVKKEVDGYSGGAEQADDITMLALKINDYEDVKTNEIKIEAIKENLDTLLAFLNEEMKKRDFQDELKNMIDIAVEEIFMNIANYAYKPSSGEAAVFISITDKITIRFEDKGRPYNPLEQAEPDLEKAPAEREIGGLGVYLVKKLMDSIEYSREGDTNVLVMTKGHFAS
jgi:sigma-B regulation protein RsbU (phosphoserine phosphatase)